MRKFLLLLVFTFIFLAHNLNSQNLITNGDFGTFDATVFSPPPLGYTSFHTQVPYNGSITSAAGGNMPLQMNHVN
jgi:hypothetical protein